MAGNYGYGIGLPGGGALTNGADGLISAESQGVYVTNAAVTLTNAGRILSTSRFAIEARAGGTVTNDATGTLFGFSGGVHLGDVGSVTNAGSIGGGGNTSSGIRLTQGGNATNSASGIIATSGFALYASYGAATVVNDGLMSGAGQSGIVLHNGGTIANNAGASISGHYSGVRLESAPGSVVNAGTIAGDGNGVELNGGGEVSIARRWGGYARSRIQHRHRHDQRCWQQFQRLRDAVAAKRRAMADGRAEYPA